MERMMSLSGVVSLAAVCAVFGGKQVLAQGRGHVVVPDSSIEHAQDIGVRAHTNHLLLVPDKPGPSPSASSPSGFSPAGIRAAYNLPANPTQSSYGGNGVIAIVDAYDYPTAANDFNVFSSQYGLPLSTDKCNGALPCFVKVYATGVKPRGNCGWNQEAALDIEWAHAMAPYAQIILVEAKSNSFTDLFNAIDVATKLVTGGGYPTAGNLNKGEVSMSWGGSEFSSETSDDSHFSTTNGVVYFASSGDTGGKTIYPSASPNVVAAGGTSLVVSGSTVTETGWSGSGGGPSAYEPRPSYQNVIMATVGTARGIPDFSFDADPNTGVSVYDSTSCQGLVGWLVFGGTSVASPSLSGIVNAAGNYYNNGTNTELGIIYGGYSTTYGTNFRDVTSGTAGSFKAQGGWDFVTGVGSDLGLSGK